MYFFYFYILIAIWYHLEYFKWSYKKNSSVCKDKCRRQWLKIPNVLSSPCYFPETILDCIMKLVWMIDYCIICKPLIFVLIALYVITGSDITPVERISYISNFSSAERRNNTVIALSPGICTEIHLQWAGPHCFSSFSLSVLLGVIYFKIDTWNFQE